MTVAIDGFGGDNAPDEVIKGAAAAVAELGVNVVITGDKDVINERFSALKAAKKNIEIYNAEGVIEIGENPLEIRNTKAGTSMGVAFSLVKNGQADAFVSAGSTAALTVGGTMVIGRAKGVKRPALSPIMPSIDGNYILLDGGANLECRAEMLLQFAIMGSVYMEKVGGVKNPRVGLLNVGTEAEKGRDLEKSTFELLKNAPVNFIGNAEARDVPLGICDVVVTDGFTGNIFLKTVEGMGSYMKKSLKSIFMRNALSKAGYLFAKNGVKDVTKKADYREIGGSPLLGTAKPVIKAHGSSDAKAFKNAIRQAKEFSETGAVEIIENKLKQVDFK